MVSAALMNALQMEIHLVSRHYLFIINLSNSTNSKKLIPKNKTMWVEISVTYTLITQLPFWNRKARPEVQIDNNVLD